MKAGTKSLIIFMVVYLGSLAILGSGMGYLYYEDKKKSLIDKLRLEMRHKIQNINAKLEYYHLNQSETFTFYDDGYDIALYDKNRSRIASTFTDETIDFSQLFYSRNDQYYLIESLYKEYLDVKYIIVRKALDKEKLQTIIDDIIIRALFSFIFLLFVALLLAKIMLYPINKSISTLTKFMKDATHEMNTPISTILMSYEHLEKDNLTPKQVRSLNRIDIATKTLSSLYNDLSFASFHDYIEYEDTPLNVKEVLEERVKYMDTLIQFKQINLSCEMENVTINMDKRKLILLIDNLLSNAIKFTRKSGHIKIHLTSKYLSVKDDGLGISQEDQKKIFERFRSSQSLQGGFGVGLDIVNQICREYNIEIVLTSELSKGSDFRLLWHKG